MVLVQNLEHVTDILNHVARHIRPVLFANMAPKAGDLEPIFYINSQGVQHGSERLFKVGE
jgi:hypothetical protein